MRDRRRPDGGHGRKRRHGFSRSRGHAVHAGAPQGRRARREERAAHRRRRGVAGGRAWAL
jgi:hypothetical protein